MKSIEIFKIQFAVGILLLFSSCSSSSKLSEIKSQKGAISAHHVSYDASRRGSLIYEYKGKMIVLSEPPPDIATKLATDLGAKANIIDKVEASLYLSTTKAIAELGKRTASVNMLRDALYKLSEMRMSEQKIDDITCELFKEILNSIKEMHAVEMKQEETKQKQEDTKQKEVEVQKVQAQSENYLLQNSFKDNEDLGARTNYQIAIQKIFDDNLADAKSYFEALYKKYPVHFNISIIRKKLNNYGNTITKAERKELYQFLHDNRWNIDKTILDQLDKESAKIKK